jgi:hypothetical protein
MIMMPSRAMLMVPLRSLNIRPPTRQPARHGKNNRRTDDVSNNIPADHELASFSPPQGGFCFFG